MIDATLINSEGEVRGILRVPDEDHLLRNTPEGLTTVVGFPPTPDAIYANGGWVTPAPRPAPYYKWDSASSAWVDGRTVEQARAEKLAWLTAKRNEVEQSGFTWDGSDFDSDPMSQQRIQGAGQLALMAKSAGQAFEIEWTLKDNSTRVLDADGLIAAGMAMGQHIITTHATCRVLKAAANAATDLDTINNINWP